MKFRFFVVFSKDTLRPPKIYKRQIYAQKKCSQYPHYLYQPFLEEEQASNFFNQKFLQAKEKLAQAPLAIHKTNLSLIPSKKIIEQPPEISKLSYIDQVQKQQRQKTVNQLLQQYRLFRQAKFKSSIAKVPLSKEYLGFFDGASSGNPGKSAIGYHIDNTEKQSIITRSQFIGVRTNNQAEMTAMILMLGDAYCHGIKQFKCYGDSMLAIKFMTGQFTVRNKVLTYYSNVANNLYQHFESISFTHIGRAYNFKADKLSKQPLENTVSFKKKQKSDFVGPNDTAQK